jgi:hypothetical protein
MQPHAAKYPKTQQLSHDAHRTAGFCNRFRITLILTLPIPVPSIYNASSGQYASSRYPGGHCVLSGLAGGVTWSRS